MDKQELRDVLEKLINNNNFLRLLQEEDWTGIDDFIDDYGLVDWGYVFRGLVVLCWNSGISLEGNTRFISPINHGTPGVPECFFDSFDSCFDTVKIPNWIEILHSGSFKNSTFKQIIISEGITEIWDEAFDNCVNLTNIVLPKSLSWLGNDAFSWCTGLETITIPNSIADTGYNIFTHCSSLKRIIFQGTSDEAEKLGLFDDAVMGLDHQVTVECTDGKFGTGLGKVKL